MKELSIKSSAFEHNRPIPKKYSCDGNDVNPPLSLEGVPKEAKTLALIMEDPDAPSGTFDHWVSGTFQPQQRTSAKTPFLATRE